MSDDELRVKALEFVTVAIIAGRVHHYDAAALATEYFAFLKGAMFVPGDDDDTPNPRRSH